MNENTPQRPGRISRRQFCAATAATAGGLAGAGWLHAAEAENAGSSQSSADRPPAEAKIDIHTHLGQPYNKRGPLTPKMLLEWMDAHGIARAVVLPLISPESWFYTMDSGWVIEQCAASDRLVPFCDIDPRNSYMGSQGAVRDLLQRYIEAGARGLGEHKCGVPIDHPGNLRIFRVCSELKLPILYHMDSARNTDAPGLPGLEKALQAAPEAPFLGHANGWWASISGDCTPADMGSYPKRPVTPGGAIDRLMDKYPNVYGDLSAGSGANAISRDPEFGREFLIRRADRLLFGTDYLAKGQGVPQFALLEKLDLPADVKRKVYRDNARRLLGLA
jgi:hypothetical protein